MIDVLRGLQHAHDKGILHRDIKPANILIGDRREAKLSDFGLAIPKGFNFKALGAKDYYYVLHLAPEVHRGKPYSIASDIYACGVTLYRLVNGDAFFAPPVSKALSDLVVQGKFPRRSHYREFVPRSLRVIINRALNLAPTKRFATAEEMRRALERLTIEKNWSERIVPNGVQWNCGWNKKCYEVSRTLGADGCWSVTVRKGKSKKHLRRLVELGSSGLDKRTAERNTQHLLQGFVSGKLV